MAIPLLMTALTAAKSAAPAIASGMSAAAPAAASSGFMGGLGSAIAGGASKLASFTSPLTKGVQSAQKTLEPLKDTFDLAGNVTGFLTGIADAKTAEFRKRKEDEMAENRLAMRRNRMTSQDFAARRGAAAADASRMGSVRPFTSMLESASTLGA